MGCGVGATIMLLPSCRCSCFTSAASLLSSFPAEQHDSAEGLVQKEWQLTLLASLQSHRLCERTTVLWLSGNDNVQKEHHSKANLELHFFDRSNFSIEVIVGKLNKS